MSALSLNQMMKVVYHGRRIGRGIGSSKGKHSGRGLNGQKSRSGERMKGFEGGQNPLYMRLPKVGFKSHRSPVYELLTIDRVVRLAMKLNLGINPVISKKMLIDCGIIDGFLPVKLIASTVNNFDGTVEADLSSANATKFLISMPK